MWILMQATTGWSTWGPLEWIAVISALSAAIGSIIVTVRGNRQIIDTTKAAAAASAERGVVRDVRLKEIAEATSASTVESDAVQKAIDSRPASTGAPGVPGLRP